jgi:hypothetical protein
MGYRFIVISCLSPFINPEDFSLKFKIHDCSIYQQTVSLPFILIIDPEFFRQISNSDEIKKFKKTKEYRSIKALFSLSDDKKLIDKLTEKDHLIDKFIKEDHVIFKSDTFDLFQYFPLNRKCKHSTTWKIEKYEKDFSVTTQYMNLKRYSYPHFFGDFKTYNYLILKEDLEPIIMSNTLKTKFPSISHNYLNQLLKSYLDLQYRFVSFIRIRTDNYIASAFQTMFIKEILEIFGIYKKAKLLKAKLFLHPYFWRNWDCSPLILIDDTEILAIFYKNQQCGQYYIVVYSNKYPIENDKLKKMEKYFHSFITGKLIFEIKNNDGATLNG